MSSLFKSDNLIIFYCNVVNDILPISSLKTELKITNRGCTKSCLFDDWMEVKI